MFFASACLAPSRIRSKCCSKLEAGRLGPPVAADRVPGLHGPGRVSSGNCLRLFFLRFGYRRPLPAPPARITAAMLDPTSPSRKIAFFMAGPPHLQNPLERELPKWAMKCSANELGDPLRDPARSMPSGSRGPGAGLDTTVHSSLLQQHDPQVCIDKPDASILVEAGIRGRKVEIP
jgi:hypothetical protein